MELDASLSWLALALTPGLASRLSARLLREFGSPEEVFRAPADSPRSMQVACAGCASRFQEAIFQARRKKSWRSREASIAAGW